MPFQIVRNDITKMQTEAIVNAANTRLLAGGGVCGAIFAAAGTEKLQKACQKIGGCPTGQAVLTKGYALPAKYVIHAVGPIWRGGESSEEKLLFSAYTAALMLAKHHRIKSIAFPLLSSGIYGYPKDEALRVAIAAIGDFLLQNEMEVYLVVYDQTAFQLSGKLFHAIAEYIDDRYADAHLLRRRSPEADEAYCLDETTQILESDHALFSDITTTAFSKAAAMPMASMPPACAAQSLQDAIEDLDESFSESLLRLIDEKGMTDVETYKKANIDRKLFSKIRSDKHYKPKKQTAIAFAVALELSLPETQDFLRKAGFALSHSNKFDIIIEYFIQSGNYNIYEINEALFAFDQALLGV